MTVFELDPHDPTPLYAQLEREIQLSISLGKLRTGDRLPTVRQLAVDLRVNANTVAKVYRDLERTGLLETRRGSGTYVSCTSTQLTDSAERDRFFSSLLDRFLASAAQMGFSTIDVIHALRSRSHPKAHDVHAREETGSGRE